MRPQAVVTLGDLAAEPARAAGLALAERDALLRQAAALVLVLCTTPTSTLEGTNGDGSAMLTPEQAAAIANVDIPWIWRRARRRDAAPWVWRGSRKRMRIREAPFRAWLARQGRP